jgi:hypothetical protein
MLAHLLIDGGIEGYDSVLWVNVLDNYINHEIAYFVSVISTIYAY